MDPSQPLTEVFEHSRHAAERARAERAFRHREAEKDNEQRRTIVNAVSAFLMTVAVVSFGVAVLADGDGIREWAQGLVTLLIGGLVGFLSGRAIKSEVGEGRCPPQRYPYVRVGHGKACTLVRIT